MDALFLELRQATRRLSRRRWFSIGTIAALAVGIGAVTAAFSVFRSVLLGSLPFKEPERIVRVYETHRAFDRGVIAPANFLDWRRESRSFDSLVAFKRQRTALTGFGEPELVDAAAVSSGLFPLLGVIPARGRGFVAADQQPGASAVVVLSDGLWRRRFGADPSLVGASIMLDGAQHVVAGVMPGDFAYPPGVQLWTPLVVPREAVGRTLFFLEAIARLKPDVSIGQAQAEVTLIANRLAQQHPATNAGRGVALVPLRQDVTASVHRGLTLVFAALGLLSLIVCANVANLMLARAIERRGELTVRSVIGADRGQLARLLLAEAGLLAGVGGLMGCILAWVGVRLFVALGPRDFPRLHEVRLDAAALVLAVAMAMAVGLVFGLLPALRRPTLASSLADHGARFSPRQRLPRALAVVECALAALLLAGAALFVRTLQGLTAQPLGFTADGVVSAEISLPTHRYPGDLQQADFFKRVSAAARALPGVEAAAVTNALPFSNWHWITGFRLEGETPQTGAGRSVSYRVVSPGYFATLRVPLLAGRDFGPRDSRGGVAVVIVNSSFARQHFGGDEDALGRTVRLEASEDQPLEIVGVVGDVRHAGHRGQVEPEVYRPLEQAGAATMFLVVKAARRSPTPGSAVRALVAREDGNQPVSRVATLGTLLAEDIAQPRLYMNLLSVFASVAVLVASLGCYSVMAYLTSQRLPDIGVRLALGARPSDIRRGLLLEGLRWAGLGLVAGLVGAAWLGRLVEGLLFGVTATDPIAYATAGLVLMSSTLLACDWPARRAARVDPLRILRCN